MSEALYERYKDALRRGHLAALHGRPDVALDAYGEASRLAPDRALPFVAIAGVLARLGRRDDALAAYDAALDRAPVTRGPSRPGRAAVRGRGSSRCCRDARPAGGRPRGPRAASPMPTDAARRALDLAESRGRRDDRPPAGRPAASAGRGGGSAPPRRSNRRCASAAALSLLDGPTVGTEALRRTEPGRPSPNLSRPEPEPESFDRRSPRPWSRRRPTLAMAPRRSRLALAGGGRPPQGRPRGRRDRRLLPGPRREPGRTRTSTSP